MKLVTLTEKKEYSTKNITNRSYDNTTKEIVVSPSKICQFYAIIMRYRLWNPGVQSSARFKFLAAHSHPTQRTLKDRPARYICDDIKMR